MLAASIAPSAAPAPTIVWISSINKITSPAFFTSSSAFLFFLQSLLYIYFLLPFQKYQLLLLFCLLKFLAHHQQQFFVLVLLQQLFYQHRFTNQAWIVFRSSRKYLNNSFYFIFSTYNWV